MGRRGQRLQRSVHRAAPVAERRSPGFSATGCGSGRGGRGRLGDRRPEHRHRHVRLDTRRTTAAPTGWGVWGGTSVASPIVAAEFALAGGAHGVSYPAATLYGHAGEASTSTTSGRQRTANAQARTICKAVAGFDGPTGVGSPLGLGAFAVAGAPESTSPPTISGYAEEGATLDGHQGGWTGSPTEFSLPVGTLRLRRRAASRSGSDRDLVARWARHRLPDPRARRRATADRERYEDSATVGPVASNVPTSPGSPPPAASPARR